jgi:hypothetical protein
MEHKPVASPYPTHQGPEKGFYFPIPKFKLSAHEKNLS